MWGGGGGAAGLTYHLDTFHTSWPSTWLRMWHSRVATTGLHHCGEAFQTRTVATRRLVDRRSARASDDVCCQRFEGSGTSFFFLSICRRFKFEAQIWAPTWCQFAQFFFVEYSCLQDRVLQARFASAFIRISSSFTSQSLLIDWLIDWLMDFYYFFFLSFFSFCSLAFSIGFLWVFTLILR
jgi:hypothetical protein